MIINNVSSKKKQFDSSAVDVSLLDFQKSETIHTVLSAVISGKDNQMAQSLGLENYSIS
jgi:hypothetical protein